MITSKILTTLRAARLLNNSSNIRCHVNSTRQSSHACYYRSGAPPNQRNERIADVCQGVVWWWVLWHLWTEPDHVLGEFEYPDPSKWSDEELGIPSS